MIESNNMDKGKKKILDAALELLLEKDISQITTREVVKKAGVNISLLHYHFKTKNDLMSEAIIVSTEPVFKKWVAENIRIDTPTLDDLEKYISAIVETAYLYPTISKSKILLFLSGVDEQLLSFGFLDQLTQVVSYLLPDLTAGVIKHKIHFLGQLIVSLRVSTEVITGQTEFDFGVNADRENYAKLMLSQIFPELY